MDEKNRLTVMLIKTGVVSAACTLSMTPIIILFFQRM